MPSDPLDITPYTWVLWQPKPGRLRLMVHLAPIREWARELRERLASRGVVGVRLHSNGSLRVDRPNAIAQALYLLGATDAVQRAALEYAALASGWRGRRLPALRSQQRLEAANRCLELLGIQQGSNSRGPSL